MDNVKNDSYYLNNIITDLSFVLTHTKGMSSKDFESNELLLDSVMFRLIQISENSDRLTPEFKEVHSDIPWHAMRGLRNRIVHDYGKVDMSMMMNIANKKGMSIRLGTYLIERVFADIFENKLSDYEYVNIPLSTVQCMQMDFTDLIWKMREKYDIHPEQISFSFKESAYENTSEVFNENLSRLSAQGYKLMLDGFGKGYSDMERISDLPIVKESFIGIS